MAMCDATTVDFELDTMPGDIVDRDAVFENTQVHYNPQQKWFYLPNQLPSELLIFKNADGDSPRGATPGECSHRHSPFSGPDARTQVSRMLPSTTHILLMQTFAEKV